MNCQKLRSDLISGIFNEEMEQHLSECASCRDLYRKVNDTMSILEQQVQAPAHLAASIMARKDAITIPRVRKMTLINYIQVAAAILFGVFLGYKFGRSVDSPAQKMQDDPVHQYFKAHHLNVDRANLNAPSLFITRPQ